MILENIYIHEILTKKNVEHSNVRFRQNSHNFIVFIFFLDGTSISPQLKPDGAYFFFVKFFILIKWQMYASLLCCPIPTKIFNDWAKKLKSLNRNMGEKITGLKKCLFDDLKNLRITRRRARKDWRIERCGLGNVSVLVTSQVNNFPSLYGITFLVWFDMFGCLRNLIVKKLFFLLSRRSLFFIFIKIILKFYYRNFSLIFFKFSKFFFSIVSLYVSDI